MAIKLTDEQYRAIDGKLFAIKQQMRQRDGYPYNPEHLEKSLQMLFEGMFPLDATDPLPVKHGDLGLNWLSAYKLLGMQEEFSNFVYKSRKNLWTVPVLKGVTPSNVLKAFRNLGVSAYSYYGELDASTPTNDRDPARDGSYPVNFKQNVEADAELAQKSASYLAGMKVKGITLLERLLLELAYFHSKMSHLDIHTITLCIGSRSSDGSVPCVYWGTGPAGLYVSWYSVLHSMSALRARAVVS